VRRKSIRDGTPAAIWLEIEKEKRQRISARPSLRSSLFLLPLLLSLHRVGTSRAVRQFNQSTTEIATSVFPALPEMAASV
jgi:hypothetical protein